MSITTLPHLSLLSITGDDAESFLQGQLTNDITQLDKQWQYSAYCNPKGRVLCLFLICKVDDAFYALLDRTLSDENSANNVVKRLRMFVMRSKVTINLVDTPLYGVIGDNASDHIAQHLTLSENIDPQHITTHDAHLVWAIGEHFIVANLGQGEDLLANQANDHHNVWLDQQIKLGLPHINTDTTELFIPQMLNLDVLDGINFKKGCYTGQEIVARMHYLGKLKQRMFHCTITHSGEATQAQAGSKVFADKELTKTAGNIVNLSSDQLTALVVLRLDNCGDVLYLDPHTTLNCATEQPYSLPQ